MDVFDIHPAGSAPPNDEYQKMTMRCILAIKHDLRRKSRLVGGRHLLDILTDVQICSSQVKLISVKLVSIIADKMGLKQLCRDVSNDCVNAESSQKAYVPKAGYEFGSRKGMMIVIVKALYGLSASGADWHRHFSNSLGSHGFEPTRYDKDV